MQPHQQRIFLAQIPVEKRRIEPGKQLPVLFRVIPEGRRIEHQLLPPTLRILLVKTGAQGRDILWTEEEIGPRRTEREHLLREHMKGARIMRCNALRGADNKGQLGIARRFTRTDFRRLADIPAIERAAMRCGAARTGKGLLKFKKKKTAAVFGAELFTLAVAGELAGKSYPTKFYVAERSAEADRRLLFS